MAFQPKDIYKGGDPFEEAEQGGRDLLKVMDELIVKQKELIKLSKIKIEDNTKKSTEDYRKLKDEIDKTKKATDGLTQIQKDKKKLEASLKKLNSDKIQQNEKLKVQITNQRKLNKELAKSELGLVSAYDRLVKKTNQAQKNFKNLATQYGETSKQALDAKKKFEDLDNQLRNVNDAAKDGRRDVGRYEKGWKGVKNVLIGGLGLLGINKGLSLLKSAFSNIVSTFSDFDKQTSKVLAISGATNEEFKELTAQAQALGESTEKTASEVSSLQLELAKLGFDPKQIQAATDSILDLSTAIDSDLAQSATVVGSTLRAYGLEAEETQRVTDTLAAAFSRSSLDIGKFQTAISTVGPVAKAFGFSLEETTALLAQLTDAGFDASAAGTATRNILLNLADTNGTLAKRLGGSVNNLEDLLTGLSDLNNEGVDLNETLQLTDKRSVAAFNTFLGASDKTRTLASELNNASGSAARMAQIMRDNLSGDTDKANSVIQGLYINLSKRLDPSLRNVVQNFTSFVSKLNEFVKLKPSDELKLERSELNNLVDAATNANNTQESRNRLLLELQDKYPSFLENINKETVSNEELRDRLVEVNSEYEKKINQLVKQELITKNQAQLVKLQLEELELVKEVTQAEEEFRIAKLNSRVVTEQSIATFANASGKLSSYTNELGRNRRAQEELKDQLNEDLSTLSELQSKYGDLNISIQENTEIVNENKNANIILEDTINSLSEKLSELQKEKREIAITDKEAIASKQVEIEQLQEQIKLLNELGKAPKDVKVKISLDFDDPKLEDEPIFSSFDEQSADDEIQAFLDQYQAIEDITNRHYDSLLSIFANYATVKKAQDQDLSAEEITKLDEKNQQIVSATSELANTLKSIYNQIVSSKLNQLQTEINNQNQAVNEQEQVVNRELQLLKDGHSNELKEEKIKLKKLQDERKKNLDEQKKLQEQQDQVNTLTQISALATAVANIIAGYSEIPVVGVVLGLAAAAAAIAGFASLKSESSGAAQLESGGAFTDNGVYIEGGRRHKDGGNQVETERDEGHIVVSRGKTREIGLRGLSQISHGIESGQIDAIKSSAVEVINPTISINSDFNDLLNEQQITNRLLMSQKHLLTDKDGNLAIYDRYGVIKKRYV